MANDTDFATLYHILDLRPGCSLDELRLAYRRRVAAVHPDRIQARDDDLKQLNVLYASALDFQRLNGRLPGALPQPRGRPVAPVAAHPDPGSRSPSNAPVSAATTGTRLRSIALLLLALLLAALAWSHADDTALTGVHPAASSQADHIPQTVHPEAALALGMAIDDVRRLEGDPIQVDGGHWEYGPSWIAFHCKRVIGWYSSPLRPLHANEDSKTPATNLPRCQPGLYD